MSKPNISWPDRFALMDHFKPTDDQITSVFGLTQDELDTARGLRQAGTFTANQKLDVAKFGNVFTSGKGIASTIPVTSQGGVPTTIAGSMAGNRPQKFGTATSHTKPESASKKPKVPQKRGRKGDKITTALCAVPTTPSPVADFIQQYGVSLPVLRQSKRFIEKLTPEVAAQIGRINVRQDKATKVLMIWRDQTPKA